MTPKEAVAMLVAAFRQEQIAPETVKVYIKNLSDVPPGTLAKTIWSVTRSAKFFPSIAELREATGLTDGWPGADEAWALVAALREEDTVVWTEEIARAWAAAAHCLPDRVAARMAFLDLYRREVGSSRIAGRQPSWWVSVGTDPAQRERAVLDAVAAGRLSPAAARHVLPPHEWPAPIRPALPPSSEGEADAARTKIRALLQPMGKRTPKAPALPKAAPVTGGTNG